jgi:hypothetical protein
MNVLDPMSAGGPAEFFRGFERVTVTILEGRKTILAHAELLEQFAERCGQYGAMHWLGYFLGGRGALWKRPYVVLCLQPGADSRSLKLDDLCGAALFYELNLLGIPTSVFSTDDWEGLRTIIAEAPLRHQIAALATEALMDRGAQVVLTTYATEAADKMRAGQLLDRPGILWAENDRLVTKSRLTLCSSFDKTLAKFGKRTRTHLRYYRKRLQTEINCEFVPEALGVLHEADFVSLCAASRDRLSKVECKRRFRATRDLPGGFLMALRSPNGRLLSSIGGWRHGTTTVMHHQVNASGYDKHSLCTAMRSYFLEAEIERGARTLIFYHGTNDTISHACEADITSDLIVRRTSKRAAILRKLTSFLISPRHYVEAHYFGGSTTFLASVLTSDSLKWHSARSPQKSA